MIWMDKIGDNSWKPREILNERVPIIWECTKCKLGFNLQCTCNYIFQMVRRLKATEAGWEMTMEPGCNVIGFDETLCKHKRELIDIEFVCRKCGGPWEFESK